MSAPFEGLALEWRLRSSHPAGEDRELITDSPTTLQSALLMCIVEDRDYRVEVRKITDPPSEFVWGGVTSERG